MNHLAVGPPYGSPARRRLFRFGHRLIFRHRNTIIRTIGHVICGVAKKIKVCCIVHFLTCTDGAICGAIKGIVEPCYQYHACSFHRNNKYTVLSCDF